MTPPPQSPATPTVRTVTYTAAPWREFFDTTTLSFPTSFSEALTRLNKNLPHFRVNYGVLAFMILPLLILLHHLTVMTLLLAGAFLVAFYYYFSARLSASTINTFWSTIDDGTVGRYLFFVTLWFILLFSSGHTVLRFSLPYAVVVCLHGGLKVPMAEDEEDPYSKLLGLDASEATYNTM